VTDEQKKEFFKTIDYDETAVIKPVKLPKDVCLFFFFLFLFLLCPALSFFSTLTLCNFPVRASCGEIQVESCDYLDQKCESQPRDPKERLCADD